MGIRTYPRSLRNGRTNDGGGQKYVVKDEFLAQKNSSNGTVSGGKNEPKYPHCVPQCIQEMGHFAGYLWAYWGRAHSDAPIRVGNTHGLADRSLVSTTGHHPTPHPVPPTHLSPLLLYSCPLVLVLLVWADWVGRVTSGALCSLSLPPCAPRGGEVGVCTSGPRRA